MGYRKHPRPSRPHSSRPSHASSRDRRTGPIAGPACPRCGHSKLRPTTIATFANARRETLALRRCAISWPNTTRGPHSGLCRRNHLCVSTGHRPRFAASVVHRRKWQIGRPGQRRTWRTGFALHSAWRLAQPILQRTIPTMKRSSRSRPRRILSRLSHACPSDHKKTRGKVLIGWAMAAIPWGEVVQLNQWLHIFWGDPSAADWQVCNFLGRGIAVTNLAPVFLGARGRRGKWNDNFLGARGHRYKSSASFLGREGSPRKMGR